MPDIRVITNTLRGLRDRVSSLAAEGIEEAQAQIHKVYEDIGYSTNLVKGRFGLLIGALKTNILQIVGDLGFPYLTIEPEVNSQVDGVTVEVEQVAIYDRDKNGDFKLRVKPDSVSMETNLTPADILIQFLAQKTGSDYSSSFSVNSPQGSGLLAVANELKMILDLTYGVVGLRRIANTVDDTKAEQLLESGTIQARDIISEFLDLAVKSVTHGPRVGELRADNANATLTLTDGTDTAAITQILLAIKNAIFSGTVTFPNLTADRPLKLGPSKTVFTGKISLTLPEDVDVSVLTDNALIKRSGSALASTTDYYTKTEVDNLLAGKSDVGHGHTLSTDTGHTHSGTVPNDGVHTHTVT